MENQNFYIESDEEEFFDDDQEIEAAGFNEGMKKNREIQFFQEEVFGF